MDGVQIVDKAVWSPTAKVDGDKRAGCDIFTIRSSCSLVFFCMYVRLSETFFVNVRLPLIFTFDVLIKSYVSAYG